MEVALRALEVAAVLFAGFVIPVFMRRRAAGARAKVEAALAIGAEVGSLRLIVAVAVREGALWQTGTFRHVERRITWRGPYEEIDLTGASVRSWRELEKSERKEVRPYAMYVALLCVHPELDDFELTAAPDDLHVVAELLGLEK
ncbi:hypothetical protein [Nonomuraea sp. NEAU-A123]|uniref:hypothetical protein n=1 Tax=Nonomuraea sp. NEAU-A123 TaxID=2839649 RepID=UPI001BE3DA64|nr:hypothetical protein [Nonomuraea sp. NEAU-A123]MBT2235662.1 hypothetical protein [Nonomuraea sp. NEAU-A123]